MVYNVCILGASLETGNMGVAALSQSLIKNIVTAVPGAAITLIISHHTPVDRTVTVNGQPVAVHEENYRLSPGAGFREHLLGIFLLACLYRISPFRGLRLKILESCPLLQTLARADFIGNINGGDSFSDIYGKGRFMVGFMIDLSIILLQKAFILLPQTYGPYRSSIIRQLAAFLIKRAQVVLSRDKSSMELLKQLLKKPYQQQKIAFCPDVAFTLDAVKPDQAAITPPGKPDQQTGWIGINVSGLLFHGGYTGRNMFGLSFDYQQFLKELIGQLLQVSGVSILLVPHTYASPGNVEDDKSACMAIQRSTPREWANRVHVLESNHDQGGIKWIIGNCAFFIGSRMHSCIAALSQGIPTVGVAYSRKFSGVFDSVRAGHLVVDAKHMDLPSAIKKILDIYNNKDRERIRIAKQTGEIKKLITDTFGNLLQRKE